MMKRILGFVLGIGSLCPVAAQQPVGEFTAYVNPFMGTKNLNNGLPGSTFPGVTVPFGFVQLSPDTNENPHTPASGYNYNDSTIVGFSHTHLNGTGVSELFDILLMPTVGPTQPVPGNSNNTASGYRSRYSHNKEKAYPGYYQVWLQDYDINVELTSTEHVGFHKYTFPSPKDANVVIDLNHTLNKHRRFGKCQVLSSQIKIIDDYTIEGYRMLTGWTKLRKVYFRIEFSKKIANTTLFDWNRELKNTSTINGTNVRGIINFQLAKNPELLVKVGLSTVSTENARINMETECPSWSFYTVMQKAENQWEKELGKIKVRASEEQKHIFYTCLYHCFIQPNNIADVNGEYPDTDYSIQTSPDKQQYSTFSLWDTFRAVHPLYTLLQKERVASFTNSLIRHYETYGYLPIWSLWGQETYCMIGNHAIPTIVDAILKGIHGIDIEKVYEAVKKTSLENHLNSPANIWEKYKYMPEDIQTQSVSITLERAFDDWCVAQLANFLNKKEDYEQFMSKSYYYRNLYDHDTGFFRPKDQCGNWLPLDPLKHGKNDGHPFTEGNAWQYLWFVPHNIKDLISLMGGKATFNKKLDTFFHLEDSVSKMIPGFIGQYSHSNEPSHHVAHLYNYSGQSWKTQQYVSKIMNELYSNTPEGYCGNDDCGQMSAWYVFNAMGFYPVNPANGIYIIGSPVLEEAVIQLSANRAFIIRAKNASATNKYIQSIRLNNVKYNKTYITHEVINNGGVLEFEMGDTPCLTSIKVIPPD